MTTSNMFFVRNDRVEEEVQNENNEYLSEILLI